LSTELNVKVKGALLASHLSKGSESRFKFQELPTIPKSCYIPQNLVALVRLYYDTGMSDPNETCVFFRVEGVRRGVTKKGV
jgi:hypothetical protein